MILLLSALLSSLSELFPQFGLSYFLPRNQDTKMYDNRFYARIVIVVLVWLPITMSLYRISTNKTIIAVLLIMMAFYYKRDSEQHSNNNSNLLYGIGFTLITLILNSKCSDESCIIKNILATSLIFIGGNLIGTGRTGSLKVDLSGRLIFTIGYFLFINQLISLQNSNLTFHTTYILPILLPYLIISTLLMKKTINEQQYFHYNGKENVTIHNKLTNILLKNNVKQTFVKNDAKYILFNSYKTQAKALKADLILFDNKVFFSIPNNYILGNKYYIWKTLKTYYGSKASDIMPFTYLLPKEYNNYIKNYNPTDKFIFKSDKQRQEGLFLTKSKVSKTMITSEKFLVAQKYNSNSILYKNHKINTRIYLVIICSDNEFSAYIYYDGIISYTKKIYNTDSIDSEDSITSFKESYHLYKKKYPITLLQYLNTMNKNNKNTIIYNIKKQIKQLLIGCKSELIKNIKFNNNKCCELFGIDVFIDKELNCSILEINIGPQLNHHNNIDKRIREHLLFDMANLVIHNKNNNFYQLL
jgi:hypothetical protein